MSRTLILGAGFGGLTAATELARLSPGGHDVTLVDASDTFAMGLGILQILDGRRKPGDGARKISRVDRHGIRVLRAGVEAIDLDAKRVRTGGEDLAYDELVLALGAAMDTPALGHNLYTPLGAAALHRDLAALEGGDVLLVVSALPFKCPPAPYEAAMIAKAFLDERGVEATVTLASPEPHPLPSAGPEAGALVAKWVEERGVTLVNGATLASIDERKGVATFADGSRRSFDVLAVVPRHRAPDVLARLPLDRVEGGWIQVDPATLETSRPDVFAIGDCSFVKLANGKALPKAGVMAESEGRVVAQNVAARLRGEPERARFDGKGGCFLELGRGEAVEVEGDFYATPHPRVTAAPPSKAALAKKAAFERERLERWFGA